MDASRDVRLSGQVDRYAANAGADALRRQREEAEAGRCPECWAPAGEEHSPLCPLRPETEGPVPKEGLF